MMLEQAKKILIRLEDLKKSFGRKDKTQGELFNDIVEDKEPKAISQ